jgi:Signal transduction histidine kinase
MKLKWKLPLLFLFVYMCAVLATGVCFNLLINSNVTALGGDTEFRTVASEYLSIAILFLAVFIGASFAVLSIYLHFKITKPIRILNERLESASTEHSSPLPDDRRDEIGTLYSQFNKMEVRLQQSREEQLGMIAAIAHDLKTPLTSINGFMELLSTRHDISEQDKQEYYELVLKKSQQIGTLINTFSTFAKQEFELETMDRQPSDVYRLFENIIEEYDVELSGLGFMLKWENKFVPNTFAMIDESAIRRTFGNLFSNAVRYGNKSDLCVYLSGYTDKGRVCFQIEDNGVGVPDDLLPLLFQKFYTVDKARQSENGGTGLGLAITKSIVEHHGGTIQAFRSPHGGVGVQFTIPMIL